MSVLGTIFKSERYARQLLKTNLFNGVPEKAIRAWLSSAEVSVEEYAVGAYLFRRSDTVYRLGILLRGSADVVRTSGDGKMHMSTLHKNDLFGAASLFGGDAEYVTDIRCNETARVLWIGEAEILRLLSENPTVLLNYLRYLNGRIRFLNKRLDALSKNTVSSRLYSYLSDEAVDRVYTVKNITKLSETLCVSRATLYRALETLESSGQIRRDGKQIIISEETT